MPAPPTIGQVVTPTGTTTVGVTGIGTDTVTLTTVNGTVLGSTTLVAGVGTVTTSSTVLPSTPLLATQTAGGVGYVSQAAAQAGFSPLPIASGGSLAPTTNVNVTVSSLPGLSESLAFVAGTETTPGSAKVGATTLGAAASFAVGSTGQIVVVFTAGATGTALSIDHINAANGLAGTTTATDTYAYG